MKTIKIQKCDMYDKYFWGAVGNILKEKYDLEFTDQPEYLFYSVYGKNVEHYKYTNCIKIFFSEEGVLPDFNECDYAVGSYPLQVGERYFEYPYEVPYSECGYSKDIGKKFCNFIYSNENNGTGAKLRKEFCQELMKYKHVDCPGNVLHNMDSELLSCRNDKNWYKSKIEFIKNYKFTIAFENEQMLGMTTEKLTQPLVAGSVPIYWGNPDVNRYFNSKAFINLSDVEDIHEMVKRVIEIDNDDDLYEKMKMQIPYKIEDFKKLEIDKNEFILNIIENGHVYTKNPLGMDIRGKVCKEYLKRNNNLFNRLKKKFN